MAGLSLERMVRPVFATMPTQVISFGMKISKADAEEWLKLWADTVSLEMKEITPKLSRLFHTATLRDYPGKAFDRFIQNVNEAIHAAEDEYAEKFSQCHSGDCMTRQDRRRMVAYLMGAGSGKREAICYQTIAVIPPDSGKKGLGTKKERPILVIAEGNKVRAKVLEHDGQLRKKILVFGAPSKKSTLGAFEGSPITISAAVR